MDDGLVLDVSLPAKYVVKVLILVVVDDGLVLMLVVILEEWMLSLNPCCNGRWSRTMHDWRKFAWKKGS